MNPFFEFHREALDPQIRENVRKTLPMLDEMKDAKLRETVIDAWALSLQLNGWTAIEEMPGSRRARGLGHRRPVDAHQGMPCTTP